MTLRTFSNRPEDGKRCAPAAELPVIARINALSVGLMGFLGPALWAVLIFAFVYAELYTL